jgi:hypothetical protein
MWDEPSCFGGKGMEMKKAPDRGLLRVLRERDRGLTPFPHRDDFAFRRNQWWWGEDPKNFGKIQLTGDKGHLPILG